MSSHLRSTSVALDLPAILDKTFRHHLNEEGYLGREELLDDLDKFRENVLTILRFSEGGPGDEYQHRFLVIKEQAGRLIDEILNDMDQFPDELWDSVADINESLREQLAVKVKERTQSEDIDEVNRRKKAMTALLTERRSRRLRGEDVEMDGIDEEPRQEDSSSFQNENQIDNGISILDSHQEETNAEENEHVTPRLEHSSLVSEHVEASMETPSVIEVSVASKDNSDDTEEMSIDRDPTRAAKFELAVDINGLQALLASVVDMSATWTVDDMDRLYTKWSSIIWSYHRKWERMELMQDMEKAFDDTLRILDRRRTTRHSQ